MKSNKGLSDVITTVLIIVLALAAVAIIGAVVLNQVRKSGSLIDATSACNDVAVQVSSCKITAAGVFTATVSRLGGDKKVDVVDVKLLAMKDDGTTLPATTGTNALDPYESVPLTATDAAGFAGYTRADVAAYITSTTSNLNNYACKPANNPVVCATS